MGAVRAVEARVADRAMAEVWASRSAGRPLRLVRAAAGQEVSTGDTGRGGGCWPRASSIPAVADRRSASEVLVPSAVIAPRKARVAGTPPLRLTRRGRVVIGVIAIVVMAAIAMTVGLAAAGGAQAANHGQPRAAYQGMHQVVVRSGQTLWSIASAAEPQADPRDVVQEIMTVNALTSTDISPGQVLWVPR